MLLLTLEKIGSHVVNGLWDIVPRNKRKPKGTKALPYSWRETLDLSLTAPRKWSIPTAQTSEEDTKTEMSTSAWLTSWFQVCADLKKKKKKVEFCSNSDLQDQLYPAQTVTRETELTSECWFKQLSLWLFFTQQIEKTNRVGIMLAIISYVTTDKNCKSCW